MSLWTAEWPTTPGYYWFFGKLDSGDEVGKVPLLVEVWEVAGGSGMCYVTSGNFLFKEDGASGLWMPAQFPAMPTETELKILEN